MATAGKVVPIPVKNSGAHAKTIKFTWRNERGPSFDQELSEYLTKEQENGYELLSMEQITTAQQTGYIDEVSVIVVTTQV